MTQTYFEQDRMTPQFFQLIGELIVVWSSLERAIDLILSQSGVFQSKKGNAILAWNAKTKALRKLFDEKPKLNTIWLNETIDQLDEIAKIRNTIVHGYCLGLDASKPPRIKFVAARFNSVTTDRMEFSPTANQLSDMCKYINEKDQGIAMIMFSIMSQLKEKSQIAD